MSDAPDHGCPDCRVTPGQPHVDGCDTARCTACGKQRITCEHRGSDIGWGQIWSGPTEDPAAPTTQRRVLTLNCSTCGTGGITVWADHANTCPGIGDIQVTRQLGRGLVVDHAPQRALIGLHIIRDLAWPANIAGVGEPDLVNIADQVLYRVVGYEPAQAALIVELVEDWRPVPTVKLAETDIEEIKARWQALHGQPGRAHTVRPLDEETPDA